MEQIPNPTIVRPLAEKPSGQKPAVPFIILISVIIIVVGVLTGFFLHKFQSSKGPVINGKQVEVVNTPTEEGVKDAASFKDTATGKLVVNDGKITTEGSHILVRDGVSQNVYLTSSVVDLEKYVGKTVQVWGETFQGQKAGWLMDVGRIKIVQ